MNKLTQTLLGGVALGALAVTPTVAQKKHPAFALTALHAGRVVHKTNFENHGATHMTYVFGVYTYLPASDFHKTVPLVQTFYKWNSYSTLCSSPKQKVSVKKKSKYGIVHAATVTYSEGCPSGPTTFYGDNYKLNDRAGFGQADVFVSTLKGKFKNDNGTYKGKLPMYVEVDIGTE